MFSLFLVTMRRRNSMHLIPENVLKALSLNEYIVFEFETKEGAHTHAHMLIMTFCQTIATPPLIDRP